MPLSRYEIRSEYSLANPDLYRAADKDDPEGLLEGVAMAGLVGIIRQLGDLAEFAAEVFHDLHEDVLATAARGHEVLVRVRQLEREVPLIETLMFTKSSPGNFMYNPGVEWHVHIHNEQNHFTQGDLPRFIRSAYEDCRSPPRLFALDRFDVTGAGACLKRFTDPSFFKMEWASSELMKAEKEQRDHKARRLKKKGQRHENGEGREARFASHVKFRVPSEAENAAISSISSSSSSSSIIFEQDFLDSLKPENEDMLMANSSLFTGQEGPQLKGIDVESARVKELALEPSSSKREVSYMDTDEDVGPLNEGLKKESKEDEAMADDSASETDNFMDAVTTMDSEVETESETKAIVDEDVDLLVNITENEVPGLQPASENPREAGGQHVLVEDNVEQSIGGKVKAGDIIADDFSNGALMPEDLSRAGQEVLVDDTLVAFSEKEDLSFVIDHFVSCRSETVDVLTLNSPSGASSSSVEEVATSKSVDLPIDSVLKDSAEEDSYLLIDNSHSEPSLEKNGVSTSVNQSGASSPVLEEVLSSSSKVLQSESTEQVVTSETLSANITDESLGERRSVHVSQLEESGVLESQTQSPKVLGAISTRKRWQINKLFDRVFLAPELEIDGSQASESELGESPKKLSSHSSPSSSIHPMRWAIGSFKTYHTDDEIDGIQGSLGSLSTTSSNLSSPRPSMLATSLQSLSLGGKQESSPSPQKSADSCPPSPMCSTPKSGISTTVHQQVSLTKATEFVGSPASQYFADHLANTSTEFKLSPASEHSAHSSPDSSSSAVQPFFDTLPSLGLNLNASSPESMAEISSFQNAGVDNLENFPPPPPLPPLAWRITKRVQSAVVSPTSIPVRSDVGILAKETPPISTLSTSVPAISHTTGARHIPDDLMQSVMHETCPSEIKALHEDTQQMLKASKPSESGRSCSPTSTSNADTPQEESISVWAPSSSERHIIVTALPDSSLHEKPLNGSGHTLLNQILPTESTPAMLDRTSLELEAVLILPTESTPARLDRTSSELEAKTARAYGVGPLSNQDFPSNFERTEFSAEATTSHDIERLKRRSKWALTSSTASSDDREVLLQQIRTRSFSLRNASGEKLAAPRPVTNINVAAILEKANAIRQAFAGSDDDEEWSDA